MFQLNSNVMFSPLLSMLIFGVAKGYVHGPTSKNSFSSSEAYCVTQSTHLATIKNNGDLSEANRICQGIFDESDPSDTAVGCWIGLKRESNVWDWVDPINNAT
eukprot:272986_1